MRPPDAIVASGVAGKTAQFGSEFASVVRHLIKDGATALVAGCATCTHQGRNGAPSIPRNYRAELSRRQRYPR